MAVDTGLQPLINFVRERGQASLTDVFDSITYWTDDQLEDVLLENGQDASVKARPVSSIRALTYRLDVPHHYRFNTTGLIVYSDTGATLTGWTYDHQKHNVTFATAQTAPYIVLEGYAIDIYGSLALLWERKANQRYNYVNFRGGHNATNLSQEWDHCKAMELYYRSKVVRGWKRS